MGRITFGASGEVQSGLVFTGSWASEINDIVPVGTRVLNLLDERRAVPPFGPGPAMTQADGSS